MYIFIWIELSKRLEVRQSNLITNQGKVCSKPIYYKGSSENSGQTKQA
jgi:hypothetical protein